MTAGLSLEVLLQAAPGCVVPADCFAALRTGGPADSLSGKYGGVDAALHEGASFPIASRAGPFCCSLEQVISLGGVLAGDSATVDIYQKVASVSLDVAFAGASKGACVSWPGYSAEQQLTFHVSVLSTAGDPPLDGRLLAESDILDEDNILDEGGLDGKSLLHSKAHALAEIEAADTEVSLSPEESLRPASRLRNAEVYRSLVMLPNCDQIMTNLYLSGLEAAVQTDDLVSQGIRAVCCCCREVEFPTVEFHKDIDYFRVDVEDIGREPIELYFLEAADFIHHWRTREQPVLVHCRAGVSRSGSIVISYLIAYMGYSLHDAFFLVRSHRAIVTPNLTFMEKLCEFEMETRQKEGKSIDDPTVDMDKYTSWYTAAEGERSAVPDIAPD